MGPDVVERVERLLEPLDVGDVGAGLLVEPGELLGSSVPLERLER